MPKTHKPIGWTIACTGQNKFKPSRFMRFEIGTNWMEIVDEHCNTKKFSFDKKSASIMIGWLERIK